MKAIAGGSIVAAVALCWALGATGAAAEGTLKETLPNGLTVLVRENGATPAVAVSLFVRVGTRWETEENGGITNFLQQLMLKGTATRSALEIADAAESIGGSINASSDADSSEIRGVALGRHWQALLGLIADVALHPSLPDAELEGERRVILSAIRNRQDQPFPLAFDTLIARLYTSHPYARSTVGQAAAIQHLDREALLAHYRRFYRAERMILSVSGDVSGREVVAEAARLFAGAPAGGPAPESPLPPASASVDRTILLRPSAQAQVLVGFLAPPVSHPDYAAMKVLSTALGGGMAGRLFTELRDKQGLAYSTGASYASRVGPGFFLAQIGTAPPNAARAEEAMKQEIERLRREPLGEAELERAKTYLLGQFALDRRTNARLAWYAAFFEAAGVGYDFAERYVRAVEAVSAADVQRVAQAYLAAPTIVSLGPSSP